MEIETKDLVLSISPQTGALSLQSRVYSDTHFQARLNVNVNLDGKDHNLLGESWSVLETEEPIIHEIQMGPLRQVTFHLETTLPGVVLILRCGLSISHPFALVQMTLFNRSRENLTLNEFSLVDIQAGNLHLGNESSPGPTFYSNGWQSWSSTGTYTLGEKQNTSILGRFQNPMVVNPGTPQPKDRNHFTGDMFGVIGDRQSRNSLLAGFLSQKSQFGSLETRFTPAPSLRVWANGDRVKVETGTQLSTDWLALSFVNLDTPDPMGEYLEVVARMHGFISTEPVPVGWCSWYHFYQDINQPVLEANLATVIDLKAELPLPLFQIDDGFETYPGDWFDFDPGFPNGLRPLVDQVTDAGLTPGVWLAPFIIHPKAKLVQEHPDWLLRDERGKPVTAGFVWNSFTLALDLTNPDALAYTREVIRTAVEEWGFTYLKLDFLYAAALKGVYQDPTQSRAQVLRMGLEALREAAGPEVTMLACGCPFGSALGLFEAMRISADVSGYWKPHFPPFSAILQNEPGMPAARNAIHNILTRASLHRHWWINDPDCLLVRPDTQLTLPEVQTLATVIGLTGGSLLLSDDLPALPEDRLGMAQVLLPVIDRRARVMDLFDTNFPQTLRVDLEGPIGPWYLLAKFNWENKPCDLTFSPQEFDLAKGKLWWLREFWTGGMGQLGPESPFTFSDVHPNGVVVAAARSFDPDQPAYLGSDLHLSQGIEVSKWEFSETELNLQFKVGRKASGRIYFYLPWLPAGAWYRNETCSLQEQGLGIYSIDLDDLDGQSLSIRQ